MRLNMSWCSLCGKYHIEKKLEAGWFADGLRYNSKGADSAKRLICPDCLARVRAAAPNKKRGGESNGRACENSASANRVLPKG
ncbi:hypothetical protein ES703_68682 [subsurface metagenome]